MPKKKSTKKVWVDEDGDGVADAHGEVVEETPVVKKKAAKKAPKTDNGAAERERLRRRHMGF